MRICTCSLSGCSAHIHSIQDRTLFTTQMTSLCSLLLPPLFVKDVFMVIRASSFTQKDKEKAERDQFTEGTQSSHQTKKSSLNCTRSCLTSAARHHDGPMPNVVTSTLKGASSPSAHLQLLFHAVFPRSHQVSVERAAPRCTTSSFSRSTGGTVSLLSSSSDVTVSFASIAAS